MTGSEAAREMAVARPAGAEAALAFSRANAELCLETARRAAEVRGEALRREVTPRSHQG